MSSTMQRSLFGNIESIYQVNGELVHQLSVQRNNVGAAFVRLAPFFKLYSMYAYDYKAVLNLLEVSLAISVCTEMFLKLCALKSFQVRRGT